MSTYITRLLVQVLRLCLCPLLQYTPFLVCYLKPTSQRQRQRLPRPTKPAGDPPRLPPPFRPPISIPATATARKTPTQGGQAPHATASAELDKQSRTRC
ncbi:hypothetical protein BDW02DRAFT_575173 [Decorospora gaudefroyi]|uniref:Uncharacterized protein n=1 Tax=Decorospora gaudefroyi TaxID=184978 RepID=A0A6A5JW21_9PLEO|nr:hypothetical protein BDW02DRAFT_575173 [Decorospora gaudefroyi]